MTVISVKIVLTHFLLVSIKNSINQIVIMKNEIK